VLTSPRRDNERMMERIIEGSVVTRKAACEARII
jgi:hypothetical protein